MWWFGRQTPFFHFFSFRVENVEKDLSQSQTECWNPGGSLGPSIAPGPPGLPTKRTSFFVAAECVTDPAGSEGWFVEMAVLMSSNKKKKNDIECPCLSNVNTQCGRRSSVRRARRTKKGLTELLSNLHWPSLHHQQKYTSYIIEGC